MFRVLTCDAEGWLDSVCRAEGDVALMSPAWLTAGAIAIGGAKPELFVYERKGSIFCYPFLRREIPWLRGAFDIESAYGYSGPTSNDRSGDFVRSAWGVFDGWARSQMIVAEFIRFHPLLENHLLVADTRAVDIDRNTVVVEVGKGEPIFSAKYRGALRRDVAAAERFNLEFTVGPADHGMEEFIRQYQNTMARVDAPQFYCFSEAYFLQLKRIPDVHVASVRSRGRLVSSALVVTSGAYVHYHLAGSDGDEAKRVHSSQFLLHNLFKWAAARGCAAVGLGGGRTKSDSDTLYRFKASFSPKRIPFRVGKRIHDRGRYDYLLQVWARRAGKPPLGDVLLSYRLPTGSKALL